MGVPDSIVRRVADLPTGAEKRPTHCSVGGDCLVGTQFDRELAELLLQRFRIVTLIALAPTALFLILRIFQTDPRNTIETIALSLQGILTALFAWLAVAAWTSPNLGYCTLRKMELTLFGSMALFFGWLQFNFLGNPELHHAVRCMVDGSGSGQVELIRLWVDSSAVRWFCLIVIYGVFIPNPWQRSIRITGYAAAAPLVLTPLGAWWYGRLCPNVMLGVLDLAIILGTAVAIGVFGSHRQQVLQREAFRARQLGQYRLGRQIGAGGMGEVYQAEHRLLRRPCALKLIRPDQIRDPAVMHRFEREVQAMAALTHPNTVEVYDFGQADDGTFYYVMEFLPGMNLESLVQRYGPLPAARVVYFLRQVCRALREAHSTGLLHRDIKPSNIIACERGGEYDVAKLLDFGLVQDLGLDGVSERLTMKGTVLGSPPFMSPEQAAGKSDTDARTDIYSLGGVGYYLLTGQPPFVRETAMEMLLAHAYEAPKPLREIRPEIPADVEAVILRCLEKKPGDRYSWIEDVEQALASCGVADAWGAKEARLWWKTVPGDGDTAEAIAVTTPTASIS